MLSNRHFEKRPWGSFERFTLNELSTVKILTLRSGMRISLQRHKSRSEFWRILSGNGTLTLAEETRPVRAGDEIEIPKGAAHRLSAGDEGLIWLEIALGAFHENDEERLEDDFGRAA